ncbi:aminotransferase class V-fold PLP-dependent enzyme [Pseudomonadota bacterium AL_CKDN230030165-1A_HGKHYDSX7]
MAWQDVFRQSFPITRELAYANVAYTSPLAPHVAQAVAAFFDDITHARSDKPQWLRDADALRGRLARLIGGDARRIAFTKNTTEGLNTVAQGLDWTPGDNLVIDDEEHPSNALPWLSLRRRGVEIRHVRASEHYFDADDLWAQVDDRTRLIALSWVQYASGLRSDIAELGRRCRKRGIWLVVDGIQGAGLLQVKVDAWQVDAFACGAHKGFLGPLGVGFVHLSPRLLEALDPPYLGPSAVTRVDRSGATPRIDVTDRADARRLETGNLNYPGIAGWAAALDLIEAAQPERIEPWVLELARALSEGLRGLGQDVVSDPRGRSTTNTVRLSAPDAALASLRQAGVVGSVVEGGLLRLSLAAYNNHDDVERILSAVHALKR